MHFKIVKFNEYTKTMIVDWGNGVILNHYIPLEILENKDITKERTIELIELMRPHDPTPIEIPLALKTVYEESNNASYTENNNGEDII